MIDKYKDSDLNSLIKIVSEHGSGIGCECNAYGECECCCDVDWRSKNEVGYEIALNRCLRILKSNHGDNVEIQKLIEETEQIIKATNKYK